MANQASHSVRQSSLHESEALESDPRWQLILRILTSPSLTKSPRLVSFLRFVAKHSLTELSPQINEQSIGVAVFGRPDGYDSNEDNIVRAHASRLRQKLETYFQNEGSGEQLRISIPKGSYIPTFYEAPLELPVAPAPPAIETSPALPARPSIPRSYWVLTLAACLICVVITYLVAASWRSRGPSGTPEANHLLWREFLDGRQNTLIVTGDSSLVLYENITGRTLSIGDYIAGNYRGETQLQSLIDPNLLHTIANRRLTTIVDLDIANRITGRTELNPGHAILRYARDLHVDDLKGVNAIFVGSQEANPWVQLYAESLNFTLIPDQLTKVFTIRNRTPKKGEAAEYKSDTGSPARRAYALVSLLSNLNGAGRTLIIQGTGMAGTEAAADYVLGQAGLSSLLHNASGGGNALPGFEILLETTNLNGNAPKSRVIASRVNGQ